jgi:hypothetical protein
MSAAQGRTVRLFLVDGSPTGLITAEIMNWTGHVLVGPRSRIGEVVQREETGRTGVYFLIGDDPAMPSKSLVYIGESDNVGKRIGQHNKDETKDYWTRLCLVTSKDQNLTKAHVRYLESRLIAIARAADRANVANGTAPDYGYLPESDIADMEFFLNQIGIVLPVLGFDFLRQKPKASPSAEPATSQASSSSKPLAELLELTLSSKKFGIEAKAVEVDGEIVVRQGSTALASGESRMNQYGHLREQLIAEGKLVPHDDPSLLVFTEDVAFNSPSAASATLYDRNDNGRRSWRVAATGQTLADWQDAQALGETQD